MSKGPRIRDMLMDCVEPESPITAKTLPDCEHTLLFLYIDRGSFVNWNATCTAMGGEEQESWIL